MMFNELTKQSDNSPFMLNTNFIINSVPLKSGGSRVYTATHYVDVNESHQVIKNTLAKVGGENENTHRK